MYITIISHLLLFENPEDEIFYKTYKEEEISNTFTIWLTNHRWRATGLSTTIILLYPS